MSAPRRATRPWSELALLAAFLLFAAFQSGIHSNLTTHLYAGGGGDICIDTWVVSRVTHGLLHTPWQPFDGNIYYPSYASVLYTDPNLGPALLVLPLRALGANPVLLYNAAVLASLTLGSYGFYLLARQLGAGAGAALLAAVAIPYSSRQMAHLFHLNLLSLAFFPFFIGGVLRILSAPSWRAAIVTGVAFALQSATSGYHAFSAALVALVCLVWAAPSLRNRRTWAAGALAIALAAVLLYPYLSGFAWIGSQEANLRREADLPSWLSMDLADLLVSGSYLWRDRLEGDRPFFPGLAVLVFAAWAVRDLRRDRHVSLLLALAVASFALALGPEVRLRERTLGPGPYQLLRETVPFLESGRHPFSFAVPGQIALGLLASLGLARSAVARSRGAVALVVLFAAAETVTPHPERRSVPPPPGPVYRFLESQPAGAILELPLDDERWTWRAAWHDLPIVNGISVFEPSRYQAFWQLFRKDWKGQPRDMEDSRSLEYLKTWFPIRYIVVHTRANDFIRASAELTGASLRRLHQTAAHGDRVYELVRRGRGPALKRAFRDDQLEGGVLRVRLAGVEGSGVQALFNGESLGPPLPLGAQPREHRWDAIQGRVRRGLNVLELRCEPAGTELELLEIEAR